MAAAADQRSASGVAAGAPASYLILFVISL
jgi:hypothetical protein